MTKEELFVNTVNCLRYVHKPHFKKDYYDSKEGIIYLTTKSFGEFEKKLYKKWE